jgi:formylglycine-generating enzyme required for sulfatase activity
MPSELQHVMWLCYEHEAMHLETLLYMMVQYSGTLSPPAGMLQQQGLAAPAAGRAAVHNSSNSSCTSMQHEGAQFAAAAATKAMEFAGTAVGHNALTCTAPLPPAAQMVQLPGGNVTIGFNPQGWTQQQQQQQQQQASTAAATTAASVLDTNQAAEHQAKQPLRFGWDNEMPARTAAVGSCLMQHRPVCVLEYLWFLAHKLAAAAAAADDDVDDQLNAAVVSGHAGDCNSCSESDTGSKINRSSSSSSSHRVVQMLGEGGLLHELLPLSLHFNTSAAAADAATTLAATAGASSGNGSDSADTSSSSISTSSSSTSSSNASPQHQFELLQQLVSVKSVFGPQPVFTAGLWPIYCSALQANAYAAWWDGGSCRLPSESELLLARQYNDDVARQYNDDVARQHNDDVARQYNDDVARQYNDDVARQYNDDVARQYNDGVARQYNDDVARQYNDDVDGQYNDDVARQYNATKEAKHSSSSSSSAASELAAVDFTVWHPVNVQLQPPTPSAQQQQQQQQHGASLKPQLSNTGAPMLSQLHENGWEWSSTVFNRHPGFEPHPLYLEYSADFFDGKHFVLLGASWATVGGIARRSSFRNWYQAGQQHVFAKFRLCRNA